MDGWTDGDGSSDSEQKMNWRLWIEANMNKID